MSEKKPPASILVIVAGTNDPSNSNMLADCFIAGMKAAKGIEVEKVRLKDLSIAHFTLDFYRPDADQGEDFSVLQRKMEDSDGIVIASPIWNFAVPAHLKNLIDRMGSFALDAETHSKGTLSGKPFYILLSGGSGMFVWNTVMENSTSFLREAIKYFGGTVIGTHFEQHCVNRDKTFGLVIDQRPACLTATKEKGQAFAAVVQAFAASGTLPANKRAKSLFYGVAQWVVK